MRRPALFLIAGLLCSSAVLAADPTPAPAADSSLAPSAASDDAAPAATTQSAPSASTTPAASAATVTPMASATPAETAVPAAATVAPATAESAASAAQTVSALPGATSQAGNAQLPQRGMNMTNVEHIFGTPLEKEAAVGKPPITRWVYSDYVVYFEYNMVLHTVMKSGPFPGTSAPGG